LLLKFKIYHFYSNIANPTYIVDVFNKEKNYKVVLRRQPDINPLPKGAHDLKREVCFIFIVVFVFGNMLYF
jgi:hypothetical protein